MTTFSAQTPDSCTHTYALTHTHTHTLAYSETHTCHNSTLDMEEEGKEINRERESEREREI